MKWDGNAEREKSSDGELPSFCQHFLSNFFFVILSVSLSFNKSFMLLSFFVIFRCVLAFCQDRTRQILNRQYSIYNTQWAILNRHLHFCVAEKRTSTSIEPVYWHSLRLHTQEIGFTEKEKERAEKKARE